MIYPARRVIFDVSRNNSVISLSAESTHLPDKNYHVSVFLEEDHRIAHLVNQDGRVNEQDMFKAATAVVGTILHDVRNERGELPEVTRIEIIHPETVERGDSSVQPEIPRTPALV